MSRDSGCGRLVSSQSRRPARWRPRAFRCVPKRKPAACPSYSTPILRAAGLGQRNIRVVIINDRSFNAFVVDAKRIFVNAGALMDSQTPNQIIGVLAHETG